MARRKGTMVLPANTEPEVKYPLDARTVVDTKSDLTNAANFTYAYEGLPVYVKEDKKTYRLIAEDATKAENWREEGTGGGVTVDPALSPTSTNPVENRAITVEVVNIQSAIATLEAARIKLTGSVEKLDVDMGAAQSSIVTIQSSITTINAALDTKVDKVDGKGLSTEDYTAEDQDKLQALAEIKSVGAGLTLSDAGVLSVPDPSEGVTYTFDYVKKTEDSKWYTTLSDDTTTQELAVPEEWYDNTVIQSSITTIQSSITTINAALADRYTKDQTDALIEGEHIELTQAQYTALPEEEKNNGKVYFITDGGAYVPAIDLIPYANQAPIVVGKLDLRGDGEFRDIKRVRLWINDLKNASEVITAGWVETGVYVRPIRIYGWFTFHDYVITQTSWEYRIQQLPIPYSGYKMMESPPGDTNTIGLKFYVDHNNKLRMVVDGKSNFHTEDYACVIVDFMETPVA